MHGPVLSTRDARDGLDRRTKAIETIAKKLTEILPKIGYDSISNGSVSGECYQRSYYTLTLSCCDVVLMDGNDVIRYI